MPTRERRSLAYVSFSELGRTISRRWRLFQEYLPPKDIWVARLSEIDQVRNRVAHFRRGHSDDTDRVRQLLRDIDHGFWRFCTSYNDTLAIIPLRSDPIALEFASLDPFPWSEFEPNQYARFGRAPPDLVMGVTIELLRRPWLRSKAPATAVGRYGYLYDVRLGARHNRAFDYSSFLDSTKRLHSRVCHICLDASQAGIRVTIPALLGAGIILPTLKTMVEAARHALRPAPSLGAISFTDIPAYSAASTQVVDSFALKWPEYVLGPSNPLTFLTPEIPSKFFGT